MGYDVRDKGVIMTIVKEEEKAKDVYLAEQRRSLGREIADLEALQEALFREAQLTYARSKKVILEIKEMRAKLAAIS